MEGSSSNVTNDSSVCVFGPYQEAVLSSIDIITILMGQPVVAKLLWITFTFKTTDILNCNLALFHNLHYLICFLHLPIMFFQPDLQLKILRFLFVYVEIGGPMSLSFICLERYVAVVHPTSYPLLKTYRCREVCAATVWLFSLPAAFLSVFATEAPSIQREKILQTVPFGTMLAMIAMMMWCSSKIAKALRKPGPAGRDVMHPVKRKALLIVRATAIITLFFYIPVAMLQRFRYDDEAVYTCILTPIGIFFLSAASVVHPVLYMSSQGKLFPCWKMKRKDDFITIFFYHQYKGTANMTESFINFAGICLKCQNGNYRMFNGVWKWWCDIMIWKYDVN